MRLELLYIAADIKRQDFFRRRNRQIDQSFIEIRTMEMVQAIRVRHPAMGARPMFHALKITSMGINRFERLVSDSGLGIVRKNLWIKTTNSNHNYFKYSNLTNGLELNWINQLWVSDITYWIDGQTHYYLLFIMDVYSRRVLGYTASQNMLTVNNLEALKTSFRIRKRRRFELLIHHSDKGSQYCSSDYVNALQNANITISMAGNSLENPYAERLNGIIKNDYLQHFDTSSFARLSKALDKAVWLYNNEKPHSELDYMPPVIFEDMLLKQSKREGKPMVLHDFRKNPVNSISMVLPDITSGRGF